MLTTFRVSIYIYMCVCVYIHICGSFPKWRDPNIDPNILPSLRTSKMVTLGLGKPHICMHLRWAPRSTCKDLTLGVVWLSGGRSHEVKGRSVKVLSSFA